MLKKKIGVFAGSLRSGSFSKKIAVAVSKMMPENFEAELVDISNLPFYNQDLDEADKTPKEWIDFRERVKKFDGFIFSTPEYNRSTAPVLKNALDVGSRPAGQNAWNGKPGAVISVSPGTLGGFGANCHLKQTLSFLNVQILCQPEMYIGNVISILNEQGEIINENSKKFFQKFIEEFAKLVEKF